MYCNNCAVQHVSCCLKRSISIALKRSLIRPHRKFWFYARIFKAEEYIIKGLAVAEMELVKYCKAMIRGGDLPSPWHRHSPVALTSDIVLLLSSKSAHLFFCQTLHPCDIQLFFFFFPDISLLLLLFFLFGAFPVAVLYVRCFMGISRVACATSGYLCAAGAVYVTLAG